MSQSKSVVNVLHDIEELVIRIYTDQIKTNWFRWFNFQFLF